MELVSPEFLKVILGLFRVFEFERATAIPSFLMDSSMTMQTKQSTVEHKNYLLSFIYLKVVKVKIR